MMPGRSKAPVVKLQPDVPKIVEAVLLLVREASRRGKTITQYEIVKSFFLADRSHLNRYGRPITFDNYYAMKHGPVPTFTYNLLKEQDREVAEAGGQLPWRRVGRPTGNAFDFFGNRDPDEDALAPSEVEALLDSFATVKSLGFNQVRKLTHEDAAYVDAWEGDEENDNGSYAMSLAMLLDVPDQGLARDLAFVSKNAM